MNPTPEQLQQIQQVFTDHDAKVAADKVAQDEAQVRSLVSVNPEVMLAGLDSYHDIKKNKISPSRLFKIREALNNGADPFLIAANYRVDFGRVARIANSVLAERGIEGRIPETVAGYLDLTMKLAEQREAEVAASQAAINEEIASGETIVLPPTGGAEALDALAAPIVAEQLAKFEEDQNSPSDLDNPDYPRPEDCGGKVEPLNKIDALHATMPDEFPRDFARHIVETAEGKIGGAE